MYNRLLTKSFYNKIKSQSISEDILIDALEDCYKNCAFSTFMYIFHNYDSQESIDKTNSANCIGLSMYIEKYLYTRYNIISFLIPATIPNKYKSPGFLEISHTALAIPLNENIIYIVDPAFYFLNPIKVDKNIMTCSTVFSKSIYKYEQSENLKEYTTIDIIESCPGILHKDMEFNQYQTISKDTYYAKSYYKDDINDYWYYFLTEIINPDQAISSFFIPIKKYPFIVTTIIDNNGICKMNIYIKFTDNGLNIKDGFDNTTSYDFSNIDLLKEKIKNLDLYPFLVNNILDYLHTFKNRRSLTSLNSF